MPSALTRMSMVTLGVDDLRAATAFYAKVIATRPNTEHGGVTFFEMPGTWLALFPRKDLAKDIGPRVSPKRPAFSGVTLAHNARSKADVVAIMKRVKAAGGKIVKPEGPTFWGGFSGYFADLDGHHWEVAWGPDFAFARDGSLRFKKRK